MLVAGASMFAATARETILGDVATVALFDDDRQIQRITYRVEVGRGPSYTIRLTVL